MGLRALAVLALSVGGGSGVAYAADATVPGGAMPPAIAASAASVAGTGNAAAAPAAAPLKPDPANAHLPRYRGTVAGHPVEVRIGPKADDPGLHGEYQLLDSGAVILLAGDRSGDTLELEESDDGTNITGVWVGQFDSAGNLSATRMNPDQSDQQPVELRPVK